MSQIVPFEGGNVPAFLRKTEKAGNLTAIAAAMLGFPSVSIKGKVFHLKRGDEKTLITKPGADDEPAANIEVVILGIGPEGANYAKQYYDTGYTEGADAKPTCYSDDGISPAKDSTEPQAKKCATCPHNQFGSRITESGGKGKNCADSKRLAIAQPGAIDDAMLLRVPAASLKPFREFAKLLDSRGIHESQAVVTKIGFDYSVAHPALTFKPVGFVDEQTYHAATEAAKGDLVARITGLKPAEAAAVEEEFESAPAVEAAPEKPAAKPKATAKPKAAPSDDDLPTEPPKHNVAVEAAPEKPAKPKPVPAPVVEIDDDLSAALDDLDFDD